MSDACSVFYVDEILYFAWPGYTCISFLKFMLRIAHKLLGFGSPSYPSTWETHALNSSKKFKCKSNVYLFQVDSIKAFFFFFIFSFAGRKNNWPPLPENFPVGPCFYQDFSVDIPVEFQKTVKIMYYLWMCKYFLFKKNIVPIQTW